MGKTRPKFTEQLQIRIQPSHLDKLERMAEREGNSGPAVVRRIIAQAEER